MSGLPSPVRCAHAWERRLRAPLGPLILTRPAPEGVGAAEVRDLCRGRGEGERADFHGGWKFGKGLEHCLRLGFSAYTEPDVVEVGWPRALMRQGGIP